MPEPTTAMRRAIWSRTFPATAPHVQEARRFLALLLEGCPAADDAILCLSEIAANAILHSRSARPGGRVTVRVTRAAAWLRVEVQDEGGPWIRRPGEDHGRGLAIVAALAAHLHVSNPDTDSAARTVAFEMSLQ